MGLTDKQQRFVEEYLIDLSATQAAIRAGYSPKTAGRTGWDNLKKPEISDAIQEAKNRRSERTEITADRVVEELGRVGFSDLRQLASWSSDTGLQWKSSDELSADAAAAIKDIQFTREVRTEKSGAEVETTNTNLKLHDKLGALKSLGQHLGMFDKDGSGTSVSVTVNNQVPEEKRREQFAALHEQIAGYRQGYEDASSRETTHPT